ncbi:MAG: TVP38/TMEM64 family protein [Eubacteriales bacterium]|nr:TVP38/TMEM64 family protein [Eubacteriales bacterium]
MKQKRKISKIMMVAVILAAIGVYVFVPQAQHSFHKMVSVLSSGDIAAVKTFLASYGSYAAAVSFCLMILQSVAAPIPAFLITFANANLFGWVRGAVLSWSSAMAGAALCFYIARILGREAAEKLSGKIGMEQMDVFFERYGKHSILIARLLPFLSFDIVSYAAGLASMSFSGFMLATGIGQLPATIIYSYVGGMLTGGVKKMVTALLLLFALFAVVVLLRQIYKEKQTEKGNGGCC